MVGKRSHPGERFSINILFGAFAALLILLLIALIYHDEPSERIVLLSFDVEPVDGQDDVIYILDVLRRENISATFFVTGEYAGLFPGVLGMMEGQEIGCHGYSHVSLTGISIEEKRAEIRKCRDAIRSITGHEVVGFRAPYTLIDSDSLDILEQEGFLYDASIVRGLSTAYPRTEGRSIGEIPVSSMFGIALEDVIWLYYLKVPQLYFYILENKNTPFESYLFHPHHIARQKEGFEGFIARLKEENVIFISHMELAES